MQLSCSLPRPGKQQQSARTALLGAVGCGAQAKNGALFTTDDRNTKRSWKNVIVLKCKPEEDLTYTISYRHAHQFLHNHSPGLVLVFQLVRSGFCFFGDLFVCGLGLFLITMKGYSDKSY